MNAQQLRDCVHLSLLPLSIAYKFVPSATEITSSKMFALSHIGTLLVVELSAHDELEILRQVDLYTNSKQFFSGMFFEYFNQSFLKCFQLQVTNAAQVRLSRNFKLFEYVRGEESVVLINDNESFVIFYDLVQSEYIVFVQLRK